MNLEMQGHADIGYLQQSVPYWLKGDMIVKKQKKALLNWLLRKATGKPEECARCGHWTTPLHVLQCCGILTAEESLKDLDEVIGDLCLHEPWRLWEFCEALIKATEACRSDKVEQLP